MGSSLRLGVLAVLAPVCGCAAPRPYGAAGSGAASGVAGLEWMTGRWMSEEGDRVTEETWTAPRGGSLLGVNRSCSGGRMVSFEYLRIEEGPEGVTYLASPQGRQPPTPFRLVEQGVARAVFENPGHDFPQRIIYWREGDRLSARVEGRQGGEPLSAQWSWRRTD